MITLSIRRDGRTVVASVARWPRRAALATWARDDQRLVALVTSVVVGHPPPAMAEVDQCRSITFASNVKRHLQNDVSFQQARSSYR
jgi:hypothetical protein